MSGETGGVDPYAAVLADLRAKRDKLDEAIKLIESIRGESLPIAKEKEAAEAETPTVLGGGEFLGMTVVEAVKKLLAARRKTMGNTEITTALLQGGLHLSAAEPANTIGSILTRRFNDVGDIVRISRGVWGLREWYPHQSFKRKGGASPQEAGSKDDAPAQEAEPPAQNESVGDAD